MTHIPNPIYENTSGRTTLSLVSTILITGGLFLLIPITQLSSEWLRKPTEDEGGTTITMKPPADFIEPEVPEDPPEPINDNIELTMKHPPLSLTQMALIIDGGGGGSKGFFDNLGIPEFTKEILVFTPDQLDLPPKPLAFSAPNYPPTLKHDRIEGTVQVVFLVTEKGAVENIRIEKASHREFATAVMEALRRARFEPGKLNNKSVITRVRQTFSFNLKS